jgi:hypothetical protein
MRFSNKIPKYSRISVPPLAGQKSPAEQRFVGGVFSQFLCHIGKTAGLLHCLRVSALFVLRLFFDNRWGGSVGIRCFLKLKIWFPVRIPTWSPARAPALSPTWPRSRSPATASGRYRLVRLVWIIRCEPAPLYVRARSAYTSGSGMSGPVIHAPALGSDISARQASAASTLHCLASTLEASSTSTLHCWTSALEASSTSAASALYRRASTLEVLAESARTSALPATDVLIRTRAVWAIWALWPPEAAPLCGSEVCAHLWSAGHSASPSGSAAATSTSAPSLSAAATPAGKRFTGQKRQCQCNNYCCFDSCLFHFLVPFINCSNHCFSQPLIGVLLPG